MIRAYTTKDKRLHGDGRRGRDTLLHRGCRGAGARGDLHPSSYDPQTGGISKVLRLFLRREGFEFPTP